MTHHFERVSMFTRQNSRSVHPWWVYFDFAVTKYIEICDLILIHTHLLTYFSYRSNYTQKKSSSMYENMLVISIKMIYNGENNCMQNICNKWMWYRNLLPNQKKINLWSPTIYLLCVDMIEITNSKLIIKTYF